MANAGTIVKCQFKNQIKPPLLVAKDVSSSLCKTKRREHLTGFIPPYLYPTVLLIKPCDGKFVGEACRKSISGTACLSLNGFNFCLNLRNISVKIKYRRFRALNLSGLIFFETGNNRGRPRFFLLSLLKTGTGEDYANHFRQNSPGDFAGGVF